MLNTEYQLSNITVQDTLEVLNLYRTFRETIQSTERVNKLVSEFPSIKVVKNNIIIAFCYTNSFAPDILEICNIYVDAKYRNLGLGKKMLTYIHSKAIEAGFNSTVLSNSMLYKTKEQKISPKHFYYDNGYEIVINTNNTQVYWKKL